MGCNFVVVWDMPSALHYCDSVVHREPPICCLRHSCACGGVALKARQCACGLVRRVLQHPHSIVALSRRLAPFDPLLHSFDAHTLTSSSYSHSILSGAHHFEPYYDIWAAGVASTVATAAREPCLDTTCNRGQDSSGEWLGVGPLSARTLWLFVAFGERWLPVGVATCEFASGVHIAFPALLLGGCVCVCVCVCVCLCLVTLVGLSKATVGEVLGPCRLLSAASPARYRHRRGT